MTISAKLLNDHVKKVSDTNTLLDMLLDFESVLDDIDLYAYKNWLKGELLEGPNLSRYWITVKLMYPYEDMPDPEGVLRLKKIGCNVHYSKDKLIEPVKVRSIEDTEVMERDGVMRRVAKKKTSDVWIVEVAMPRRYVDEFSTDSIEAAEDQYVDMEDIKMGQDSSVQGDETDQAVAGEAALNFGEDL